MIRGHEKHHPKIVSSMNPLFHIARHAYKKRLSERSKGTLSLEKTTHLHKNQA